MKYAFHAYVEDEKTFEEKAEGFTVHRIQSLADCIFAFAMTLLVLDLKEVVPTKGDFWQLIHQLGVKLLYYIISFMILGIFWTGHHAEFHYIKKTDRSHLWMNILVLMCIATIPYSASLLASRENHLFAVVIYGLNITITNLAFLLHWHYATSKRRLTVPELPEEVIRDVKKRMFTSNMLLVGSLALSLWNETISVWIYILIQLYFIFKTTRTKTGVTDELD